MLLVTNFIVATVHFALKAIMQITALNATASNPGFAQESQLLPQLNSKG